MADREGTEGISEEQAEKALFDLTGIDPDTGEKAEPAPEETAEEEVPEAEAQAEEEPAQEEEVQEETHEDDIESLNKRLADAEAALETQKQDYEERMKAHRERSAQNQQILRDRFMRKASAADRMRVALEKAMAEEGLDPSEAKAALEGFKETMNKASLNYTPPPEPSIPQEEAAEIMNDFLNEKNMTQREANDFAQWFTSGTAGESLSPQERALAENVHTFGAFLHVAYPRFRESANRQDKEEARSDAAAAVKSVKRTQRQAARAASTSTKAPKKQPAGAPKEIDYKKLTDDDISTLARQAVEQYR